MRVLTAAIGALLISATSHALSQGLQGRPPQGDSQQSEAERAELQHCEPQPADPQCAAMDEAEPQRVDSQRAAMDESEPQQGEPEQAPLLLTRPPRAEPQQGACPDEPNAQEPERAELQTDGKPQSEPPHEPEPQQREVGQVEMQRPEPQQAEPPQAEQPQAATQSTAAQESMQVEMLQDRLPRDAKWTVFIEPSFGTRMDLPSAVFSASDGPAPRGKGRQFRTPDGRAVVWVYSQRNKEHDTPASYLRKHLNSQAAVDYKRVTTNFFAASAVSEGVIYYSRCNVSPLGTLHCFDLKYPAQEKTAWDGIVTRMSRSLR